MCLYVLVSWAIHRCAVVGLFIYFTLDFSSRIIWFQLFYTLEIIFMFLLSNLIWVFFPQRSSACEWLLHGYICKASTKAPLSDPNPKLNTLQFYPTQLHINGQNNMRIFHFVLSQFYMPKLPPMPAASATK